LEESVQTERIEATIFYRHTAEEVRALNEATITMADHIRAVSDGFERGAIKLVLGGGYFREFQAGKMCAALRRAAKYARSHLDEYFPLMRNQIIADAEALEEAVAAYRNEFERLENEAIPTK
jgi:hypothetical protein